MKKFQSIKVDDRLMRVNRTKVISDAGIFKWKLILTKSLIDRFGAVLHMQLFINMMYMLAYRGD